MTFLLILFVTLGVFFIFRVVVVLFFAVLNRIFGGSENEKFQLGYSVLFLMAYLHILLVVIQSVLNCRNIDSNLEWYLTYTFMGISAILWSYFSWELKWKAKPKFGEDDVQVMIKKIIVFAMVMIFVFYQGYTQLNKLFSTEEGNTINGLLVSVTNITIIPGIIALDRVLNQVKSLKNELKKRKEPDK